jgi:hypothetical protein
MMREGLKVALADIVLLFALYSILQDLQWRTGYAASLHSACPQFCGYSPSFSYSLLTQFFTLAGNGVRLTSTPTLDWVQLLAYVLVILNGWYAYKTMNSRRVKIMPSPAHGLDPETPT